MNLRKKFDDIVTLIKELDFGITNLEKSNLKMVEEIESKLTNGREKKTAKIDFKLSETKSVDGKGLRIKGIASTASIDRDGDIIKQEGISFAKYASGKLPMFYMHSMWDTRGGWDVYEIRDGKLYIEGDLRPAITPDEQALHDNLEAGNTCSLSVGFFVNSAHTDIIDGNEIRVFEEIEIYEISIVSVPANPDAVILDVKSKSVSSTKSANTESEQLENAQENKPVVKGEEQPEPQANPLEAEVATLKEEIETLKNQLTQAQAQVSESDELVGQLAELVENLKQAKGL